MAPMGQNCPLVRRHDRPTVRARQVVKYRCGSSRLLRWWDRGARQHEITIKHGPWSATMIDVRVGQAAMTPVPVTDGPINVRAFVHQGSELAGEILIWTRDGFLIGLEQAWYLDEPPRAWPTVSDLTLVIGS